MPLNTAVPTRAAHQKFEPTRKAEVAAFAKSWRYESRQRRVNCGTLIAFGVGAMGYTAQRVAGDSLGAVVGRLEAPYGLHVVVRHDLIGFRDEPIELLFVPYKVRALHGTGIAVVRQRTGFPSDDIVEVRAQAIVACLGPIGRTSIPENLMLRTRLLSNLR